MAGLWASDRGTMSTPGRSANWGEATRTSATTPTSPAIRDRSPDGLKLGVSEARCRAGEPGPRRGSPQSREK